MPRRTDIHKNLIIGSGPIVIGQACEFDYSGTQACRALKQEGFEVVLVNSNPATIMTDPEIADRTYVEPLTSEMLAQVIERERPDALLPTVGGQTALNLSVQLAEEGILDRFNVEPIGFPIIVRPSFTLGGVGGGIAYNIEEFREIAQRGLSLSPVHEVLLEESVIGWKEFELEVMRDRADNFVVICSIENVDPMGVHT